MIIGSDHSWYDWAVQNPDLSYSYCPINFATAYRNGVRFTFLKACSGWSDTRFYQLAIRDARAAGLLAAPYVWLYENNATQQADFWYLRLKNEPAIWIDFESYLTSVPKAHDLYEAIERLRSLGYKGIIGIYSSHDYWTSYSNSDVYWKQFPICFARYLSGGYPPPLTYPWTDHAPMNCDFWQWSALGSPAFYGVVNGKDAVDEQKFDGTPEQLAALFGAAVPPEPPPGDDMNQGTVITASLYVRNAPVTGAVIGGLYLNDIVEADRIENGWWHLTKIRGVATVGENWAYEGAKKNYIRLDAVVVPPTTETATVTVEHEGKRGTATIPLLPV
jgi:hypothetical protein